MWCLALLTAGAAALKNLEENLQVERWWRAVFEMSAAQVRTYLLGWEVTSDRTGFEDLVEFLHQSGLSGPGLVFLQKAAVANNNIPLLSQVTIAAPVVWEFLERLKDIPPLEEGSEAEAEEPKANGGQGMTLLSFVVAITAAVLLTIGLITFAITKHPRNLDAKVPGNRTKRNRIFLGWGVVANLIAFPMGYFLGDNGIWHGLDVLLYVALASCIVLNLVSVMEFSEIVSRDLLENASADRIQESLKNTWTNTALLAALMFTIVATYAFPYDGELTLMEFASGQRMARDLDDTTALRTMSNLYQLFVNMAFVEYLISMVTATINVMFVDGLSPEDAAQYFRDRPDSPAAPGVWLICALVWHVLATTILYWTANEIGWTFLIFALLGVAVIFVEIHSASVWAPKPTPETIEIKPAAITPTSTS
jgi:hypothetical protein